MPLETLRSISLFENLEQDDIRLLAARFEHESFPSGVMIFEQGGPADKLFLLTAGRVEVRFKPDDGEPLVVTTLVDEGVFGWSAALGRSTYTSCAVATEASEALSIEGDVLRRLCAEHPQTGVLILERLAAVIAERLRNTHEHVIAMLHEGMRQQTTDDVSEESNNEHG